MAAPNASRATCGLLCCSGCALSFSGSAGGSAETTCDEVAMRGENVGWGASMLGDGDVRNPALAIEVRCDSGFADEVFKNEIGFGRLARIDVEAGGFEIATGSLLPCIDPAMNSPFVLPDVNRCRD